MRSESKKRHITHADRSIQDGARFAAVCDAGGAARTVRDRGTTGSDPWFRIAGLHVLK